MTTTSKLDDDVIQSLTSAQRNGYFAWLAGHDLRQSMSRPAFYKLRKKLLALDVDQRIDIAIVRSKEPTNVIPLVRILEAKPASIPDWAIGTPLYFEPRIVRAA